MRVTARRLLLLAWIAVLSVTAGFAIWTFTPSELKTLTEAGPTGVANPLGSPFVTLDKPRALPEIRFSDGEGRTLSLSDFHGRPVLLNIWATWCVPCRKEMPSLDRLQALFGTSQLVVLPLSIDRQGTPVVTQFYQELGLKNLGTYVDQSGKAPRDLHVVGVPTTLLIDRDGREIGRKTGALEWDGPEMVILIRERLGLPSRDQKASP